jgi:ribosomal-protein-alanine N-acetyltransferase
MTPFDLTDLLTTRLHLRKLLHADTHDLLALYGDPAVMRYWSHPAWTSPEQAHAAIAEAESDRALGRALHLAMIDRVDARLAGSCALFDIHPQHRRATLGYLLARPFWGQGLAGEGVAALIAHGFGALGLLRIEAEVARGNIASQALLARLGFRCEGRLRARWCVAGEAVDVDLWALLRDDWPA